jgi:TRAP-type mannitol/chloroaromatic compound transport system substrate-binding protein
MIDKKSYYWVEYMNMIIFEFASSYKLPVRKAYIYLKQYGGIDFLNEFYDVEHTENPYYTVRTLLNICRNHGGTF